MWPEGEDMANGVRQVLAHLQQAGGGLSDGQLLGRFVATRDEPSFAALVRRHGPMVLGVCRRVLGDLHHAEDAFQATFLVLARKAASLVVGESLGCWLYRVAYHTALRAGASIGRRRVREWPMNDVPHPEVAPPEAQDWLPVLDRELSLLPEKYRAAILLCDLEGRTRKEAARLLRVPEGTLSSRLCTGRQMLAKRMTKCGVALSGVALAVALAQGAAPGQVTAALVSSTTKAAALIAAGQVGAVSTTAVLLMKGVMKAMLMKKLRLAVGAVMVLAALGMVGFGYQAGGGSGVAQAAPPDKPLNELEALRKENELLKLNLQVVLEKVRAQEAELQAARKPVAAIFDGRQATMLDSRIYPLVGEARLKTDGAGNHLLSSVYRQLTTDMPMKETTSDPVQMMEGALKALREAKDKEGQRRATEALEKALEKLKQQHDGASKEGKKGPQGDDRPR
jgi:RNA polymerase sigma factor (sigma-70 family)